MRRLYLLCSALLFTTLLWSQPSFTLDLAERTCPYDSTVTGMFPTAYELFYTRDDTYDGPIDSAYCVSFSLPENNRYLGRLDTAGLPRNRPFYIRYRYPEGDSLPLLPYTGYFVFASVGITRSITRPVWKTSATACAWTTPSGIPPPGRPPCASGSSPPLTPTFDSPRSAL